MSNPKPLRGRELKLVDILIANPGMSDKDAGLLAGYPAKSISQCISRTLAKPNVKAELERRRQNASAAADQIGGKQLAITREGQIDKLEAVFQRGMNPNVKGGLPASVQAVRAQGEYAGIIGDGSSKTLIFNGVCPNCGVGVTMHGKDGPAAAGILPSEFRPQLAMLRQQAIDGGRPEQSGIIDVTPEPQPPVTAG
jgi:hypothetical protein